MEHKGTRSQESRAVAGSSSAVADDPPFRVLIVDDKADIRMLLATRIEIDPRLRVVGEAGNGSEAIVRARETKPDAIILDLEMPGMDGYAAIPILRTVNPAMRILVFSGYGDGHSHRLQGAAKPDGYVVKGADLRVLMQQLNVLLEEKPDDVMFVDLGEVPLQQAINAFDGWVGLNLRIREATAQSMALSKEPGPINEADLMALMGIFIALGDNLLRAAQSGASDAQLLFQTRRSVGQAARRALTAIDADDAVRFHKDWHYEMPEEAREALGELRQRLLDRLPAG